MPAPATGQTLAAKPVTSAWNPPRLPDGQPEVQGMWASVIDAVFTPSVADDAPRRANGRPRPPEPSRIVDPPDHQVPYQTWAREKQRHIQANINDPAEEEFVDPQVRCLPGGAVRSAVWHDIQILQYPGYVIFEYEGNHVFRIVPLDGRPHASESIKLWMGDSRGHWEGTTLVVDVTNNNSKGRLSRQGDFASENLHLTERYTFVDAKNLHYEATFEDPTVYTRPWKIAADFVSGIFPNGLPKPPGSKPGIFMDTPPGYEQWEEACHEGEHDAELSGAASGRKSEVGEWPVARQREGTGRQLQEDRCWEVTGAAN
jgi:hypothetical protein